ncbi:MAG: hypothetical protein B7Y45_08140 [Sphingomonas sp. 28-66-16]|nr:MAG: hypothetical protein B7Y45_08140 [Sphingomonas sp. 28-66-16]
MKAFERKTAIIIALAGSIATSAMAAPIKKPPAAKKAVAVATQPTAKPAAAATPTPAPGGSPPTPIGNPGSWFPADSYPPAAKAASQEGRTAFSLDIDNRGRILACNIIESSGSELLDSTTCSQLIANGRFKPAVDASGKPIAGKFRSAMRWALVAGTEPVE